MKTASARLFTDEPAAGRKVTQAFSRCSPVEDRQDACVTFPPCGDYETQATRRITSRMATVVRILIVVTLLCAVRSACAQSFSDDFNRPDSSTVGNGWLNASNNTGGNMTITSQKVGVPINSGFGTIYRPFAVTSDVRVQGTLIQGHGFNAFYPQHYTHFILFRSDGLNVRGCGIWLYRSDNAANNSRVSRVDTSGPTGGATEVDGVNSSFQFANSVELDATFYPDGSIQGTLRDGVSQFAFTFPPRAITATGGNFAFAAEYSGDAFNSLLKNSF